MNDSRTRIAAAAWMVFAAVLLAGCGEKPEGLVAAAKESLAKHDRNAAIIHLKNALQINPDLGEARLLLGKSQLEAGEIVAAERDLRKARELKMPDEQVVPPLARALLARGAVKEVIDEFGNADVPTPEARADLATTVAQAQMATGNLDAARAGFAAALQAVPGYPPALLGEARVTAAGNDLPAAMAMVDKALAASPTLVEGWVLKGDIATGQRQLDDAAAAYRKALELRHDNVVAHSKLAMTLLQQGKLADANAQVDALDKVAPKHPQTLYLRALLAFREKNFPAAREAIQQQLRAAPDNLQGLVLEGNIEFQLGSYSQAETSLRKALARAPNLRLARMVLVNTYLRSGQPVKALDALPPLLDDGEPTPEVLMLAGEVQMRNGNPKEAERLFAKASALDPTDATKRTAVAVMHVRSGEVDRGMKELEEAAAVDTGVRADLALISAYARQRKFDAALKAIDDLEKKQPDKPLAHDLRGGIYADKGDLAAARRSFERAAQLDPMDFPAAASLARLDLADRKPEEARKRFEALLAKDPKNVRALLALAELRAQTGGTEDEVAGLIGRAVSADATSVAARLVLISHYLRNKEPKKAVQAAQEALAVMPDRAELLDASGQAQLAAGDANQAVSAFGKLVQARPSVPEAYVRLASAQIAAKDPDSAAQSLKKALSLRPDMVNAQQMLVKLDMESGREADAFAVAREIQKQRPKQSIGYVLEGDINVAKKAWPQAIAAYRNGLKNAGTYDLVIRLDAVLRYSGNVAEADKTLNAWLRDHPNDREIRMYLAEAALGKKDWPVSAARYKEVLAFKPDDVLALNNLAYVAGQMKDPKALEYAEKAVKLAPGNAAVLDTYGMLLVDKGDSRRGVEYMQRATELAPASNGIRLNYARALIKDGQKPAAKKELETLAKLGDRFPEQAEVAKLMQGL